MNATNIISEKGAYEDAFLPKYPLSLSPKNALFNFFDRGEWQLPTKKFNYITKYLFFNHYVFKLGGMTTAKILILKIYFTGGEWQRVLR